jgi:hypothetical protein
MSRLPQVVPLMEIEGDRRDADAEGAAISAATGRQRPDHATGAWLIG